VGVVKLTLPTSLPTGKNAMYSSNKRLNSLHSWCGSFEGEKNILPSPGIEFRFVQLFQENSPSWKM
jgi:hypothetical protein